MIYWDKMDNETQDECNDRIYTQVEGEIRALGWDKILSKYHPDNNIYDEKAGIKFKIYKSIYDLIKKKEPKKVVAKSDVKNNWEQIIDIQHKTITRFQFFSAGIIIFTFLLLIIKVFF